MTQSNALPFLIINYGVEVMYVLHSRLTSQKVASAKVNRVMTDLVTSMLNEAFLNELFRPQRLYSEAATRSLFESVCDASIIHLDATSLRKLHDLVSVTLKYQFYSMNHPMELVEVSLNHLSCLAGLAPDCAAAVESTRRRLEVCVAPLTHGDLMRIRQQLLNFCNSSRVRGSLLMERGLQRPDGTFNPPAMSALPPPQYSQAPGVVRYLKNGTQTTFPHIHSGIRPSANIITLPWNPFHTAFRMNCNGINVYEQPSQSSSAPPTTAASTVSSDESPTPCLQAYRGEVAYLRQLVGASSTAPQMERIQLDFFGGTDPGQPAPVAAAPPPVVMPVVEAAPLQKENAVRHNNEAMAKIMRGIATSKPSGEKDDLLNIMDDL